MRDRSSRDAAGRPTPEPQRPPATSRGRIRRFLTDASGSAAFDCFLIAAFIGTAVVVAAEAMGLSLGLALGLGFEY